MSHYVWITGAGGLLGKYLLQTSQLFAPAWRVRGLTRADLDDPKQVSALAHAGALDEATLLKRFGDLVTPGRQSL